MGALWTLKDAQDRLATLMEAAERGEPQRVALDGEHEVVVVSARDYDLLSKRPKTFHQHLMEFPEIPEELEDVFEKREPMQLDPSPYEVEFD